MNVLIRNVKKDTKWNEVIGIVSLLTSNEEFIEQLDQRKSITFDDKKLNLSCPIKVEKQGNGNLCVEFMEEG